MSRLFACVFGEDAPLRGPPLTAQSTRRSPHRRLYGPGGSPTETWWLWHDTNNTSSRPTFQRTSIPVYCAGLMRRDYDRLNLLASNRPEIPDCLLFSQPHRSGCRRHLNSNALRVHRRPNSDDCTRPCIFSPLLPCQHRLRTDAQSNHGPGARHPDGSAPHGNVMIY